MQLFFKEHFQPIIFPKLKDLKLENCLGSDNYLLDNHQRSHYDTITVGLKEMIYRVLQWNISQLDSSFNSLLEKHLVLNLPSQPNPKPIQSVIERENPWRKKHVLFTRDCW